MNSVAPAVDRTVTNEPAAQAPQLRSGSLVVRIGQRFGVDHELVYKTLIATAFRQRADRKTGEVREPTKEEMMSLLIIAETYNLNPFTRELYAFMDPKSGAIIPIVSVDGWLRIINSQPELASIQFNYSEKRCEWKGHNCHEWIECVITRRDRDQPVAVREYFDEVVRRVEYSTPWDSHPNRMHRHKAIIQSARVAFGFANIHDPDEGERIYDSTATRVPESAAVRAINDSVTGKPVIEHQASEKVPAQTIEGESYREPDLVAAAEAKTAPAESSNGGKKQEAAPADPPVSFAHVAEKINAAATLDALNEARDLIRSVKDPAHRRALTDEATVKEKALRADDGK